MTQSSAHYLSVDQQLALVRRMDLIPLLVRRELEEEITRLVNLPPIFSSRPSQISAVTRSGILVDSKGWTEDDLHLNL